MKKTLATVTAKLDSIVHNRRLHAHAFRYCLAAHVIHVTTSAPHVSSLDALIAFAAALGTLLIHLTEESESEREARLRKIAREEASKLHHIESIG